MANSYQSPATMAAQRPTEDAGYTAEPSPWRRAISLISMAVGILLAIGSLWWVAFWLHAGSLADIQFTGMSMDEYQFGIRSMLILGTCGMALPAMILIVVGLYLRKYR